MSYQPPVTPGHSQPPVWPPQPPPAPKSRALPILVVALSAALIAVGVLGFLLYRADQAPSAAEPARPAPAKQVDSGAAFQVIDQNCRTSEPSYDIEDSGHTLNIIVGGPTGMSADTMDCVFGGLAVPDAVRDHISTTRALDGQQTDAWDGYTARWTYHPDDGLQMTIRAT